MQLGTFQKDPKTAGAFIGAIRTLTSVVEPVRIVPRLKAADAHKDAPDFDILGGPNKSDFGAAWLKKRQEDGIEYLSCRLFDPAFNNGEVLRPALWPRKDGSYALIHEPIEPAAQATADPAPAAPAAMNGSGRRAAAKDAPAPGKSA
jgi:uncharacterized protein (DUF736 family)